MKVSANISCCTAILLGLLSSGVHSASSSANYTISRDVLASGGNTTTSSNYTIQSVIGQTMAGVNGSANYLLYTGFLSIPDSDGDGILDNVDNCLNNANVLQVDTDLDGVGNACDPDDDNDGLSDAVETTLGTNPLLTDTDNDGLTDFAEVNFDGNPGNYQSGVDTDPNNPDTDGDGLLDGADPAPLTASPDGDLAPLGAPDGIINIADVLIAHRIVRGDIIASPLEFAHGDVYPPDAPDGVINIQDLLLIQGLILP